MKLKELKRTVNPCWSPCEQYPVMLATGSAAQQVDASFSSTSLLELYGLNLEDPGLDLELKSSVETQHKFQKLVWSGAGVIVGGCDGGLIEFYSADRLLKNANDALLGSSSKHSGHVSALDINPYQKNLLASGASDSEIFIWDLNNTSQPMTPGNRSQPLDHVQGLAWNQQVQHILGSTFATRCVVWDLRKNEPIMKLSDSQSRTRWRALAWHPSVATQLCIASEDDLSPVIQLWDLRLAASPLMSLEGHHKGVLALSWSPHDSGLLLSAGKDGRVLCTHPDHTAPGGEPIEVWSQPQWVFEVSWSSRIPGVLATASFDQQLAVHSLLASGRADQSSQAARSIMDSFGGAESFRQLPAVEGAAVGAGVKPPPQPTRAPAWLRRPAGAKFAFGGKLVTFEKCPMEAGSQKLAYISQVVSEPELVERAAQLDMVLGSSLTHDPNAAEQLAEYCRQRGDSTTEQGERYTWFFLRANFLPSFRSEALNLLGFKQDEIPSKFKNSVIQGDNAQPDLAALSRDAHTLIERKLANIELDEPTVSDVVIPNGEDSTSLICRALVCGNLEEAVELCLEAKRTADALVIASLASQELVNRVQQYHVRAGAGDPVALLAGSLLKARWAALVKAVAPRAWRHALAALLTHCAADALPLHCEMLGDKLASESDPSLQEAATICYLCSMSADRLVSRWARSGKRDAASLVALTERALLAKRAGAARGRHLQEGSTVDSVLNEYAYRLAAQGCLQSALNTLEDSAATELRERLGRALGLFRDQRQQPQVSQFNRNRTFSAQSHKRGSVPHGDNTYNTVPAPYEQQPWQQSSVPAANSFPQHSFPPPLQPSMQPQPLQTQPFQPQPLQPQPFQPQPLQPQPLQPQPQPPPRPGSVGPQSGGLTSRSKYKVDPSVASAPLYNQYSFNNQPQTYGYNSPLPDQYNSTGVANSGFTPLNNNMGATNPMNPVQPAVNGGFYNQAPEQATVTEPPKPVAPGWNDPPMMSTKTKPKPEMPAQAPITHPLFGVEPPQHVPLTGPAQYGQYPGQQYPGQVPAQYPGQMPGQYPAQGMNQQHPGQQYQHTQQYPDQMNQAYQQQGRESPAVPVQPPPVVKKPMPEQYSAMVNVFESLRNECYNRATQPQMKRKLEDVQKRLEILYDLLRENKLSETALSTLQSCAALAARGESANAAHAASSLAAGAEFAAVAGFLPALKGLLQLAAHLQAPAH